MQRRKISFGNSFGMDCNLAVLGEQEVIFASCVAYQGSINAALKEMKKSRSTVHLQAAGSRLIRFKDYTIERSKNQKTDLVHFTIRFKDQVSKNDNSNRIYYNFNFIYRNREELEIMFFNKITKHTAVPILKEWMPIILDRFIDNSYVTYNKVYATSNQFENIASCSIRFEEENLITIISEFLSDGRITINNCTHVSECMRNIRGLDEYLNTFGETLANSIKENFTPKFNPLTDVYDESVNDFDDYCFDEGNGIQIFEAQKRTIQASVNQLNLSKNCLVIGEMGTGKTLIGSGITYSHGKQTGYNCVVMCPSHLIEKWKREIERFVPNSEAIIVSNLKELMAIENKIKNKARVTNLYVIMSKDSAKFDYELRPSAIWSISKNCFCCPSCGQPLFKEVTEKIGSRRYTVRQNLTEKDFLKPNAYNQICKNDVLKRKKDGSYESQKCDNKIWVPLIKEDFEDSKWIKLGAEGWIYRSHLEKILSEMQSVSSSLSTKDRKLFLALMKKNSEIKREEDITIRAPRKYALSKYIKKYMKGCIDYFIADELHLYKSDSKQGQAMADIFTASDKFIGLTGTLLNGYAEGLFYILYRIMPQEMKKEGFNYNEVGSFMKEYGVIKKTSSHSIRNGRIGDSLKTSEKKLPGVSPIVFTKFLLDNAVFLNLSDMSSGLPDYNEYPIGVDMDPELLGAYQQIESTLRSSISFNRGGATILSQMLQTLTTYPDMPYNQPPIMNLETNEVILTPNSLDKRLRAKETRLLEIIDEKIEAGERILVYYQWTNKTDTATKLEKALKERGYNTSVLTASVKASDREEWIKKKVDQGCQVLLCNPTLVETGLDLLDFTNIVFYQVGYNIFTMRQASRRSWRLGQDKPINVYFLYYRNTVQEQALSLMATKLQASMAIEGKFSEEGLRAMSNNEDMLTKIAESVVSGIKDVVEVNAFSSVSKGSEENKSVASEQSKRIRKTRKQISVRIPKVLTTYEQTLKNILMRKTVLRYNLCHIE